MRLRHLLSAESAANDGLAYPFLTIAIYLTVDATKREAIGHWFLVGCLCMSPPSHLTLQQEINDNYLQIRWFLEFASVLCSVSIA